MDTFSTMRAFRRIVELGGLARAAEDLGLSSAGLSKQLRALEAHLDTVLLQRTTRSMSLTETGRKFRISSPRHPAVSEARSTTACCCATCSSQAWELAHCLPSLADPAIARGELRRGLPAFMDEPRHVYAAYLTGQDKGLHGISGPSPAFRHE